MAQTLLQLRTEAQQRANQENKTLVLTPEWNRYINEAIGELYDRILSSFPHYYLSSFAFTLSGSNQQSISALSPLFYKMAGLDFMYGGTQRPQSVHPISFQERNKFGALNFSGSYTLWYRPPPVVLVNDGDTLDFILDNWSKYISATAAIQALIKEESDTTGQEREQQKVIAQIDAAAPNRDSEPGQAADLSVYPYGHGECGRRYMLEGTNLIVLGSDAWDWA